MSPDGRIATDRRWSERLLQVLPGAILGDISGVDFFAPDAYAKHALREAHGTIAVDMESHVVAKIADACRVPFVSCRIILDQLDCRIPVAVQRSLRLDGTTNLSVLFRSLLSHPGEVPELLRLIHDMYIARRVLMNIRKRIGVEFGFPANAQEFADVDLGQRPRRAFART